MIPRIYLLLIIAMLPLSAQTSVNNGDKMYPEKQQEMAPAAPAGPATIQPGVNAPPPGVPAPPPAKPAAPLVHPRLVEFTVLPSTYREGMIYKDDLKTKIKLNVPAKHAMVFHIVSSDPQKAACTDITLIKDSDNGVGGIRVNWKAIYRDTSVEFKAYAVDEPELILHGRIYLKKKLE